MTQDEIQKIKEGLNTIQEMLEKEIDFSDISLSAEFMSALTGKVFENERKKIAGEATKYDIMKTLFIKNARDMIAGRPVLFRIQQHLSVKKMKNYYIVTSPNITEYSTGKSYGSFFCIFDSQANLTFSSQFGDGILLESDTSFFLEKKLSTGNYTAYRMELSNNIWNQKPVFLNYKSLYRWNSKLLQVTFSYQEPVFDLYNLETDQIMISDVNGIAREYPEFKSFEPGKFYFITKTITKSSCTAHLNFFIDLEGNLASKVIDIERAKTYPVVKNQNQKDALQQIYNEVGLNLQTEHTKKRLLEKRRADIYKLKEDQ